VFSPECMDFDHRDGEDKVATVSQMCTRSKECLLAEIAKCDLVCANCHRTRTMLRRRIREDTRKANRPPLCTNPEPRPVIKSLPHVPLRRSCWAYASENEAYQAALASGRRWYARNRVQKLALTKERVASDPAFAEMKRSSTARHKMEELTFIQSLKIGPCTDCHERFSPECMDFDHLDPSTKRFDLARMTGRKRQDVLDEIAKCVLVCANCHRKRTRRLKQGVTRTKNT
jgi:hypothetical protein